ncbi:unnamed protein product [Meloidogyne enterolobii]|uniref:Uncharacterized protein n=1 Tax=Meloidogyne enterolobii TaxID=390850 RepID=A0ACB1A4J8_MELEN
MFILSLLPPFCQFLHLQISLLPLHFYLKFFIFLFIFIFVFIFQTFLPSFSYSFYCPVQLPLPIYLIFLQIFLSSSLFPPRPFSLSRVWEKSSSTFFFLLFYSFFTLPIPLSLLSIH